MSVADTCHRMLSEQLRNDPVFAFDFARRFRDIPPIEPDDIESMLVLSMKQPIDAETEIHMVDVTLLGHVRPDAKPLPNREPWPDRWLLSIEILDEAPALRLLLDWPHRHAVLRAQFRCPLTPFVVVPNFGLAACVNQLFAVEPELTPIVVVSQGIRAPSSFTN